MPVRIHVDAASGGMVAPFVEPRLKWDFRCENVWSISTSGHKYGLVYRCRLGHLARQEALPEDLIFWVSYLGGEEATMAITSRSASQIVGQYYVFLRNGFEGFRAIHQRTLDVARYMAREIESMGLFDIIEDAAEIPIACWRLKKDVDAAWTLYDLADRLRMRGWLVPAYPLPADLESIDVQRLVVRQDFSMELAIRCMEDMKKAIARLEGAGSRQRGAAAKSEDFAGFDHSGRSLR